jgi:hypothetical protein
MVPKNTNPATDTEDPTLKDMMIAFIFYTRSKYFLKIGDTEKLISFAGQRAAHECRARALES